MLQKVCKVTSTKESRDVLVTVQNVANFKHQICLKFFTSWPTLLPSFIMQTLSLKTKQTKPKAHVEAARARLYNEQTRPTLLTCRLDTASGRAVRSPSKDSEVQVQRPLPGRVGGRF